MGKRSTELAERSTENRVAFTKAVIGALPHPADGERVYYYDAKTPTLTVCITSTGRRSFYLYRRVNGRPQRILLGRFPTMTVEQARRQAAVVNHSIDAGGNPQAEKRAIRHEATLRDVFDRWLELHAKPHKRTWENDTWMFDKYLAPWQARPVSSISKADVTRFHVRAGKEHGPYQANRVLVLVNTLFNFAAAHGSEHPNPCKGIRRFPEEERERFLNAEELQRLFAALKTEPDTTLRDLVLVLLLTGQRRGSVQAMRWDEVNLKAAVWRIPAERSKNGKPVTVPLGTPALAVVQERRAIVAPEEPFVFPSYGPKRSACGHVLDIRKGWERLLERAELKDVRLHDLRRTFGSWQAAQGTSLLIIGKALGHLDPGSTRVYSRLDLDPVRHAVESATTAMLGTDGAKLLQPAKPTRKAKAS